MGKKDKKKGKGAEKTSTKTEKKHSSKLKKELALKGEDDIESLLAKFSEEDKKKMAYLEEMVPPPSKRSSFTLTTHPEKDQLILFGGEFFNGSKTFLYNDLFFYNIKQDRWIKVSCPGGPPPRSSHQAVALSQGGGQLWIFGGEFTSSSQSQFYHYKDLWVFHFSAKKWEKVTGTGNGPSSRSGHRMVAVKKQLIIFGGFHDNLRDYKYFNDIYIFNLESYAWKRIEVVGNGPSPRSGCQMVSTLDGKVLIYGGYCKEKIKKDVDKGIVHSDMFLLSPDKHDLTGLKWKWHVVKPGGIKPSPRCAFSMTISSLDKAIMFGGVYDTEEDEEELEGSFYNDLFQFDLTKHIWHEVCISSKKENQVGEKRRRRKNNEDDKMEDDDDDDSDTKEDLENMVVEEKVVSDDGVFTVTVVPNLNVAEASSGSSEAAQSSKNVFLPPPRINAGVAVKRGVLYLYGGMYEEGEKQLTLNDFYSLDLNKLDEWKIINPLNAKDLEWFDSESESEDEGSEKDDDEEDSEDDDQEKMETS